MERLESEKLQDYALSIGFKYTRTDPDCISYYKLGYVNMCFTDYEHIGCVMGRADHKGTSIRCYTIEDIDNGLLKLNVNLEREIEIIVEKDVDIEHSVRSFIKSLDVDYKNHYASGMCRVTIVYDEKLK